MLRPGIVLDELLDFDVVERVDGSWLAPGKAAAVLIDSPVLRKQTVRRAAYRIDPATRELLLAKTAFNCKARGEGQMYLRRRIPNAAERTVRAMVKEHVAGCRFCRPES